MTNFENDIACPEPNEKKSGSRKNHLYNVLLENKEILLFPTEPASTAILLFCFYAFVSTALLCL